MPPSFATSVAEPSPHPAGDRQLRDGPDTPAPRGQVPRRWGTALVDPDPGHDHLSGARLTLGIEGSPLPAAVGVGGSAGCRWERPDAA
jgi:hypothetical protein